MKIVITGVEGYIGTVLAPFLQERGHEVLGVDTGYFRDGFLFSDRALMPSFPRTINRDFRRLDAADLAGVDAVVHLAELEDPAGELQHELIFETNHRAVVRLAELSKVAGASRFVYLSSTNVYAPGGASSMLSERSAVAPRTPYLMSKVVAERDLLATATSGFSTTVLRKAITYGSSPRMRFDTPLNDAMAGAATVGTVSLPAPPACWRPFVHVLDVCEAVACCLDSPRDAVHAEVFNVGQPGDNCQMLELATMLQELHPTCKVSFQDSANCSFGRVSFSKLREHVPAFHCYWDLRRGMRQLKSLFERIKLDVQTHQARRFARTRQLRFLIESSQLDEQLFWIC